MAKGYNDVKERAGKVSMFGKSLVRRSKSTCELCGESERKLNIHELGKKEIEPDFDRCVHICDECVDLVERLQKADENKLRVLNHGIWSETPIVKALSVDIINKVKGKYSWIDDMLDMVYLDEETEELLEKIK